MEFLFYFGCITTTALCFWAMRIPYDRFMFRFWVVIGWTALWLSLMLAPHM